MDQDGNILDTTEYYNGASWEYGPNMMIARNGHCAVQLNATHTMVIGGDDSNDEPLNNVAILDIQNEEWTEVERLQTARFLPSCTLMDDSKVLVVGGYYETTTEIYDPATNEWTYGPELPFTYKYGTVVLSGNKPTLIGGYADGSRSNQIYQLDDGKWNELETKLAQGRTFPTATQVPLDAMKGCN